MTPRGAEGTKWQGAQRSVSCLSQKNLEEQTGNESSKLFGGRCCCCPGVVVVLR